MRLADALRLVRTALPERRSRLVLLIGLGAVAAVAEGAGLVLLAGLINQLPEDAIATGLRFELAMGAYLAITAAGAAAVWARTLLATRLRFETADRLRRDALDAVLHASWPALRRLEAPATTHVITVEAARVGTGIDFLLSAVTIAIRLPVLALVAFRLSAPLAAMMLALSGAAAFVTSRADRRARTSGERLLAKGRLLQTSLTETLNGRRIVKLFGLEQARMTAFANAIDESRAAQMSQQRVFAGSTAALALVVPAGAVVMLWIAVRVTGMPLGNALVFALAFARLGQSVLAFRSARRLVIAALPAEASLRALIDDARREREARHIRHLAPPEHAITLNGVSLTYDDGTTALTEVTATIPVRTITAITGPSGAGKSSLADIIMGLITPSSGKVAIDGHVLGDGDRAAWRAHVGYVPQDAFLFHEPIRSNLLAARPAASEADLWHVLEQADAAEMVRALPDGLDTVAGERGTRLSGGEAQRVALARALLRDPALLVLDEPTSALDAGSEARVAATLTRLKARRTIVVVAHREALAAIADQVIALDRGRTARRGDAEAINA